MILDCAGNCAAHRKLGSDLEGRSSLKERSKQACERGTGELLGLPDLRERPEEGFLERMPTDRGLQVC